MRAKVAFNYGFGHEEMKKMRWEEFKDYFNCIESLRSDESMRLIQSTAFPYQKKNSRDRVLRNLRREISKPIEKEGPTHDLKSMSDILSRTMGNG